MTNKYSLPRGTADILPPETILWQNIEQKVRKVLENYNYREIRTPVFEETALFKRSLGQTSDVVNKQLLELVSTKEEGFALRPEGTASIVRSYIENSLDKKESLSKLYYIGPMFRGERPQKGRLRQFHQIGVEAIGPDSTSPYLDAEVIHLSLSILKALGLGEITLKINTLGTPQDKENFSKLLRKQLEGNISKLCEDCQSRFERNVFRVLDCKNRDCKEVIKGLSIGTSYLSPESLAYYNQVKAALTALNISYQECPDLVRGLDYYTHTVFEITSAGLGSQDALGAGGRYNNLVEELGGSKADAIGFALGIERIILALGEKLTAELQTLDCFLLSLSDKCTLKAFETLKSLREANISCDMNYRSASMKSLMRLADKSRAEKVLILGEDELQKGIFTVKNMKTGEQSEIKMENIYQEITKRI
ncbi:MAG: histidine--tRNA ligase [Candidatus Omnitrophica bacterium]|nr:histidine--tRNA ligase [Candidatus Omnitrophota bacterium]